MLNWSVTKNFLKWKDQLFKKQLDRMNKKQSYLNFFIIILLYYKHVRSITKRIEVSCKK